MVNKTPKKKKPYWTLARLRKLVQYEDDVVILDLSRKKLTEIPKDIASLANEIETKFDDDDLPFFEINLGYNNLTLLSKEDYINLNHFDIIHLIGFKGKELSHEIKHLTNPIVLNFSFSNLKHLPEEIYSLAQLKSIRINWTEINNFSKNIKNLKELIDVEVSETPFLNTIYTVNDNNDVPVTTHEKEVWAVKQILDDLDCEIVE